MTISTAMPNLPPPSLVPPSQLAKQQQAESNAKASAEKLRSAQDAQKLAKIEHLNAVARDAIDHLSIDFTSPRNLRKVEREARILLNEARQNKEELQRELNYALSEEKELYNRFLCATEARKDIEVRFEQAKIHLKLRERFSEMVQSATMSPNDDSFKMMQTNLLNDFNQHKNSDDALISDIDHTKKQLTEANALTRAAESENSSASQSLLVEQAVTDAFLNAASPREARAIARAIRSGKTDEDTLKTESKTKSKQKPLVPKTDESPIQPVHSPMKKDNLRIRKEQRRVSFSKETQCNMKRKCTAYISLTDIFMTILVLALARTVYLMDENIASEIWEQVLLAFSLMLERFSSLMIFIVSNLKLMEEIVLNAIDRSEKLIDIGYKAAFKCFKHYLHDESYTPESFIISFPNMTDNNMLEL